MFSIAAMCAMRFETNECLCILHIEPQNSAMPHKPKAFRWVVALVMVDMSSWVTLPAMAGWMTCVMHSFLSRNSIKHKYIHGISYLLGTICEDSYSYADFYILTIHAFWTQVLKAKFDRNADLIPTSLKAHYFFLLESYSKYESFGRGVVSSLAGIVATWPPASSAPRHASWRHAGGTIGSWVEVLVIVRLFFWGK